MHKKLDVFSDSADIAWSRPIEVSTDMESFVPIPQCFDIKVKVRCISLVTHITIEPISRAEISAKEVRNRIKSKDSTVVIGHTEEQIQPMEIQYEDGEHEGVMHSSHEGLKKKKSDMQICVGAYFQHLCVVLQDEVSSSEDASEVVQVCVDNLYISHIPSLGKSSDDLRQHTCYSVCVGNMQIDNQLYHLQGLHDFPVLFIQQKDHSENFPDIGRLNVVEKLAVIKSNSFAHIQIVMETDCLNNPLIRSLELSMHAASVNIDDSFIYRILKEIEGLIPIRLDSTKPKSAITVKSLPKSFKASCNSLCSPVRMEQLCIQPINVLLSVHASLKLFLASDRTPLSFGKFERKFIVSTTHQLTRVLAMHYASGALFRAGRALGIKRNIYVFYFYMIFVYSFTIHSISDILAMHIVSCILINARKYFVYLLET